MLYIALQYALQMIVVCDMFFGNFSELSFARPKMTSSPKSDRLSDFGQILACFVMDCIV